MPEPLPFTPYSAFLSRYFSTKVQKLPVDCGAGCPVRDGSAGTSGCAFCNGRSFVPSPAGAILPVPVQLERGKRFYSRQVRGHASVSYLAYFQAGSNTYPPPADMMPRLEEALGVPDVEGLVIATRPDCITPEWTDCLARLSRRAFVMVELGVESVSDEVLRGIGRGHDTATSRRAILELASCGIPVGVHTILGLPGETRHSLLDQARWLSNLPVSTLKLHQLQVLRGSQLGAAYAANPRNVPVLDAPTYVRLVADCLERLHPRIAIDRFVSQSPPAALIAPRWGLKNDAVTRLVTEELNRRHSFQGRLFDLL